MLISKGGTVNTSAVNAGGGNININVQEQLYLSEQGSITTSVQSSIGDGGNISIENPQFSVLNQGQIVAQADAGHGGNIHLTADNVLQSVDSLISASSRLGIDGNIDIAAPDESFSDALLVLNKTFLTEVTIQDSCETVRAKLLAHQASYSHSSLN